MSTKQSTGLAFVVGQDWAEDVDSEPGMIIEIKPSLFPSRAEMIRATDLLRERIVAGSWPEFTEPAKVKRAANAEKNRLEAEADAEKQAGDE